MGLPTIVSSKVISRAFSRKVVVMGVGGTRFAQTSPPSTHLLTINLISSQEEYRALTTSTSKTIFSTSLTP